MQAETETNELGKLVVNLARMAREAAERGEWDKVTAYLEEATRIMQGKPAQ